MISEKGKQYALYMHHCHTNHGKYLGTFYEPEYGEYNTALTLRLEKGNYKVSFIEPESLRTIKEIDISSDGNEMNLLCPRYALDIAIKIIAKL